jgi:hypothetical protein
MSADQILSEFDPDNMLLLEDGEYHAALSKTNIRTPNTIVGCFLMFTRSKAEKPLRPGQAAVMVLKKDPLVAQYWAEHLDIAKKCEYKFDPEQPQSDPTKPELKLLRNDITRGCARIQTIFLKGCEKIAIRYGGIALSEEDWEFLRLRRQHNLEMLQQALKPERIRKAKPKTTLA